MGNVKDSIAQIISKRGQRCEELEKQLKELDKISECITQFKLMKSDEKYRSLLGESYNAVMAISTEELEKAYRSCRDEFERLAYRFGRGKINISFVGKAGQGKSLILQNISGLDGDVIPSADGMDCTGAKSVIENHDQAEKTVAEIVFYTEAELLDIVNKYIALCSVNGNIAPVTSAAQIRNIDTVTMDANDLSANDTAKKEHLKKYIEHIDELLKYITPTGKSIVAEGEDIESYVAQFKDSDHSVRYYTYLAVKEARISCAFPHKDCGDIVLVDTIGIGDTSYGVEEKMLDTVKNDSDAVVLMWMPSGTRQSLRNEDTELVDKLRRALGDEYAKELLFWVVNRVESGKHENAASIPGILKSIDAQKGYGTAKVFNADCFYKDKVEKEFLEPMLSVLTVNLAKGDDMLIDGANEKAAALKDELMAVSRRLGKARLSSYTGDFKDHFKKERDDTYNNMMLGIRNFFDASSEGWGKYNRMRNKPCEEFNKAVDEALKRVYRSIPAKAEIEEELMAGANANPYAVFNSYIDNLRLSFIDKFMEINPVLEEIVERMKREVVNVFIENGKFGMINELSAEESPDAWLDKFIAYLDSDSDMGMDCQYPLIKDAIARFRAYNFKVEGFLIYIVRDKLGIISQYEQCQIPPPPKTNAERAEAIREYMEQWFVDIKKQLISDIEVGMIASAPNKANYSAITDLYDRCNYSLREDGRKARYTVRGEWEKLYDSLIVKLWPQECESYEKNHNIAEYWNKLCSNMDLYAKSEIKIKKA